MLLQTRVGYVDNLDCTEKKWVEMLPEIQHWREDPWHWLDRYLRSCNKDNPMLRKCAVSKKHAFVCFWSMNLCLGNVWHSKDVLPCFVLPSCFLRALLDATRLRVPASFIHIEGADLKLGKALTVTCFVCCSCLCVQAKYGVVYAERHG